MSGAYSNKKRAEDEKTKRHQSEKHHETLLKDKLKAKSIHDDAEARRNRKKLHEEEKRLEEEKHRIAVLEERRRLKQEYIEDFKRNLREQRKNNAQPPQPEPIPDAPLVEEIRELSAPSPRVVQARAVEKLLSDELKEIHRKLMFTIPLEGEGDGSDEIMEKRIQNDEMEDLELEKNGAEELIKSRHIRWRDFETSQPISSEYQLTTVTSSSSIGSVANDDVSTTDHVVHLTSDDATSIMSNDVAAFEAVSGTGTTQKLRIQNTYSPSSSSSSPSPSSPIPPSVPKPNTNPRASPALSPVPSSATEDQRRRDKIHSPTLSPKNNINSSSPSSLPSRNPSNLTSPLLSSQSATPTSPLPSSPLPCRNSPIPTFSTTTPQPPISTSTPPSHLPSSSTSSPDKSKPFQSKIPRLKSSIQHSSPPVSSSPPPPTAPDSLPEPIRAHSPELIRKNSRNSSNDLNNSTQLFEYMEELVRRSGVSMDQILDLANERAGEAPISIRNNLSTGLSMEEDRLLHALRDLEKTGAQQQNAIGKLYKEINEMIKSKPLPKSPPVKSPPRTRVRPKSNAHPTHAQPTQFLAQTQPTPQLHAQQIHAHPTYVQPTQLLAQSQQEHASFLQPESFLQQPLYTQPMSYIHTQSPSAYMQVPPSAQTQPPALPTPSYTQPMYAQPAAHMQQTQLSPNTARKDTMQLSPSSARKANYAQTQQAQAQAQAQAQTQMQNLLMDIPLFTKSSFPSTTPKSTPRAHLRQSPKPSPRAAAHKLQPARLQSSPFDLTPPNFATLSPSPCTIPQPPPYPSPSHITPSPAPLQHATSYSRSMPPNDRVPEQANAPSGLGSNLNSVTENGSSPRTGAYAKRTRPLYAKPVEVLASPLPTPSGSPAATPRRTVEPSSFQKWKSTFGGDSQPSTSRSHYSESGNDRLGLMTNARPKQEGAVELLERRILDDVDLEDVEDRESEEEEEEENGEEFTYQDDEFESYSSEDEQKQQEDQEGDKEIDEERHEDREEGDKDGDQESMGEERSTLAKTEGRILKTEQARLLFG